LVHPAGTGESSEPGDTGFCTSLIADGEGGLVNVVSSTLVGVEAEEGDANSAARNSSV